MHIIASYRTHRDRIALQYRYVPRYVHVLVGIPTYITFRPSTARSTHERSGMVSYRIAAASIVAVVSLSSASGGAGRNPTRSCVRLPRNSLQSRLYSISRARYHYHAAQHTIRPTTTAHHVHCRRSTGSSIAHGTIGIRVDGRYIRPRSAPSRRRSSVGR